jgi:hypothetical protein
MPKKCFVNEKHNMYGYVLMFNKMFGLPKGILKMGKKLYNAIILAVLTK